MEIKYTITEKRGNLWTGKENRKILNFDIDVTIDGINPKEMPSVLLAERIEAVQTTLIRSFLKQEKRYEDGLKTNSELAPQDIPERS